MSNDQTQIPKVWVVRAFRGQWTDVFVSNGYIGLGYLGDTNLDTMDMPSLTTTEEVRSAFRLLNPSASPASVSQCVNQIETFRFEITTGDYVLIPSSPQDKKVYCVIVAKGNHYRVKQSDGLPCRNRRKVHCIGAPLQRTDLRSSTLENTAKTIFPMRDTSQRNRLFKLIGRDDLIETDASK